MKLSWFSSVPGGPDTDDEVFLLSQNEAESLFASAKLRQCRATDYAKKNDGYTQDNCVCRWWLRSLGNYASSAACVSNDGEILSRVNNTRYAVRPAVKISFEALTEHEESPELMYAERQRMVGQLQVASQRSVNTQYVAQTKDVTRTALSSPLAQYQVGDTFAFGRYPQGANGEVKPIEWQVLRRYTNSLLVIAKYALDCKKYNEKACGVTWSQCTLRQWLNNEFITQAFNVVESKQIIAVHLQNPNSKFDSSVSGGPATEDKIFLLRHDEAECLFASAKLRQCQATDYAKKNDAYTSKSNGKCWWWLRSPGRRVDDAVNVDYDGGISYDNVKYDRYAVRPAFRIAL